MAHLHNVIDTDTRFTIDPITRQIKNAAHKKVVLVQNDHNSEVFTFECPRIIEGHDMSLCNEVEIHYLNTESKGVNSRSGFYTVQDFGVDPEDESKVVCSWVIDRNATGLVGSLVFLVRYKCKEDKTITYDWHSEIYKEIRISDGINADERFEGDYVDVIDRWKDSVMAHFTAELAAWKARTVVEVKEEAFEEIATERKRIDLLSNYVTPEMFGAKGDGVTDDTEAVQAAIDSGKIIYLSVATYYLTRDIVITNPVKMIGVIANNTKDFLQTKLVFAGHGIILSDNASFTTIENVSIYTTGKYGIATEKGTTLHDLNFTNLFVCGATEYGYKLQTYKSVFTNCRATNCSTGLYLHGSSDIEMTTCTLINCYSASPTTAGFILENVTYSSLINCACDDAAEGWAYCFIHVRNITMQSCGCERCRDVIKFDANLPCNCFTIDNLRITNIVGGGHDALIFCGCVTGFTIKGIHVHGSVTKKYKFYTVSDSTRAVFLDNTITMAESVVPNDLNIVSVTEMLLKSKPEKPTFAGQLCVDNKRTLYVGLLDDGSAWKWVQIGTGIST